MESQNPNPNQFHLLHEEVLEIETKQVEEYQAQTTRGGRRKLGTKSCGFFLVGWFPDVNNEGDIVMQNNWCSRRKGLEAGGCDCWALSNCQLCNL